jgi:hypothetical protein
MAESDCKVSVSSPLFFNSYDAYFHKDIHPVPPDRGTVPDAYEWNTDSRPEGRNEARRAARPGLRRPPTSTATQEGFRVETASSERGVEGRK